MAFADYLRLMRIPALFTAASNILAAHLVATDGNWHWPALGWTLLASVCLYHAGMVFNDIFDLQRDRLERPFRPLPSAAVSLSSAWILALSLMLSGLLFAALTGLTGFLVALTLAVLILLYDGPSKGSALAPPLMAACRWTNWLLGLSVGGLLLADAWLAAPVFLYTLGLTLIAGMETRAGDRKRWWGGYLLCVLAAVALWLNAGIDATQHLLLGGLLLIWLLILAERGWSALRADTPAAVQGLVRLLIMGMIPLDALLLFAQGGGLQAAGLLLLLLPGWWASRWMAIT